ncbi:MAG: hypothetical protein AB2693_31715, partial [Candidatus Thiodiazotropha sp.]
TWSGLAWSEYTHCMYLTIRCSTTYIRIPHLKMLSNKPDPESVCSDLVKAYARYLTPSAANPTVSALLGTSTSTNIAMIDLLF